MTYLCQVIETQNIFKNFQSENQKQARIFYVETLSARRFQADANDSFHRNDWSGIPIGN